jgi:hypothetical protein
MFTSFQAFLSIIDQLCLIGLKMNGKATIWAYVNLLGSQKLKGFVEGELVFAHKISNNKTGVP